MYYDQNHDEPMSRSKNLFWIEHWEHIWMKIGVNISNFPMSLSAVGFHVCLAAIFVLYYVYWVQLNMFETVRYLGMLAIPTFIFGNRLLSGIAAKSCVIFYQELSQYTAVYVEFGPPLDRND
ncbi:hypothetical protein KUTeg_000330 [Tegillarca granosa]|uniref:Ribophorin II C-terminal domain-containing protein n=1 Tax=Tegillarca granosa TaxID=220873 RepID=A0ABQ9FX86_TEGGR|nr:hypothetical protein KUTeg_000330 [Tegillarca granosa]